MKKIIIVLVILFSISQSLAATYYVDNVNDGTGDTGTIEAPFDTIAACTSAMSADGGDTCFVRAGTYSETITPKAGKVGAKNTYAAYNGETVNIPRVDLTGGQDYVRIIGFTFTGGTTYSISIYNTVGVEILYNTFTKTSSTAITSSNASNTGNSDLIIRGIISRGWAAQLPMRQYDTRRHGSESQRRQEGCC
jgi:hypothetical protein